MNIAILYVNSHHENQKYIAEANKSVESFKKYLPDAKYYLYTDINDPKPEFVNNFDVIRVTDFSYPDFMKDRVHLNGQMVAKHRAMLELKEDVVMYLGADTYALKDAVGDLPKILKRFDIALAHAPVRINTELGNSTIPEVPISFPEYNCDVILYKNDESVRAMLKEWQQKYLSDDFSHPHDQGTFRYLLYTSNLRLATLPPEYNYRGDAFRGDTVVLQNRFVLDDYIKAPKTFFEKVIGKLKA
jgi:hypothetical protein